MNLLVDELPEAVEIDGQEYPIRCDHRTCIRIILAFEDDELTGLEKQAILLENLYGANKPPDLGAALEMGLKFLNGGETGEPRGAGEGGRLYSFRQDASYIYAAFKQTHGIDLERDDLHWWKFLALFMDLGADTTFCNLVSLRKRIKTGKASKEEMRCYREMRDVIDLPEPDTRTLEEREREAEFLRLVAEGERRRAKETQAQNQS